MKLQAVKKPPASYTPPQKKRPFSWGKLIYSSVLILLAWVGIDKLYQTYSQVEAVGILYGAEVSIESPFAGRILKIDLVVGQTITKGRECVFFDKTDMEREVIEKEGELPPLKTELARGKRRITAHISKEKARLELGEKKLQGSKKALYTRLMRLNKEVEVQNAERKNFETIKEQKEKLVEAGALTKNDLLAVQFQLDPIRRRLAGYTREIEGLKKEISGLDETIDFLSERMTNVKNEILKQSLAPIISEKIRQAEIEIETLRGRLQNYVLTSPVDGIVAEIIKKPGEIAGPREVIARVVDPTTLRMKGYIQPDLANDFPPNATVEVQFDNGTTVSGTIEEYDPVAIPLPDEFRNRFEATPRVLVTHIRPINAKHWPTVPGLTAIIRKSRPLFAGGKKP